MAPDYYDIQQWGEHWKAEGKTPDEAANLAAAQGASTIGIALMLCHVFHLPLRAAKSSSIAAIHGEKYRGKP